ncbi:MAG: hypothetical protein JWM80_1481 [Cyanobacteria bacterium RYN_339]|nr:hypothetical protein [Cyanobacteria bacterium RYN_339]
MPKPSGRRSLLALTPAWALLALLLLPCAWSADWGADESTLLWEATSLARGGLIYQDFFTFLPPGAAGLLAAVFRVVGPGLAAAHGLAALLALLVAALLALFAHWQGLRGPATLVPGALYVGLVVWPNPTYAHHGVALAFGLGALAAGMRGLDGLAWGWWALAGGLAGAALMTTQTDGLLALAVLGAGLACAVRLRICSARAAARGALAVGAGVVLPLLVTVAWLASAGLLGDAWRQAYLWPLAHYKRAGGFNDVKWLTDLPGLLSPATPAWHGLLHWYARVVVVLAPYVLVAGVPLGAIARALPVLVRRDAAGGLQEARFALLALAALGSLAVCLGGRADYLHTIAYATPAVAVGAIWAWSRLAQVDRGLEAVLPLLGLAVAGAASLVVFGTTMRLDPGAWLDLRSPDARVAAQPALAYLRDHTGPADRVIAAPWGGLFYRCVRAPATRYTLITPPSYLYQDGADRRAIDADLHSGAATYVIVASELPPEQAVLAVFGHPLPGYRFEVSRPLTFHGRPLPQHFFRRVELGITPVR